MEPGGKGVLYEIHKRRPHRRGAGDRRKRAGIKEKKRERKRTKIKKQEGLSGLFQISFLQKGKARSARPS